MAYQGDYAAAATVVFNFNTVSFSDGSPITLAGTPALSVYKNSTTESTAGITLTVDYDSRTGMHHVVIDTSADGTFYAAGNDFDVVITAGTVGGTSVVGRVVGSFSLANRSALRPTTAGRSLDVSAGGEAGVDWANVGSPTTSVNLSGTTIATTQQVDVNTIKTQAVTCSAGVTVGAYVGNATAAIAVSAAGGVTLADGVTHGGTTAMMRLGSSSSTPAFYLTNSGGPAWKCEATAGNNQGAEFWGSGSGGGVWMLGGSNGNGLAVYSQGAASALLLFATGTGKDALLAGSGTIVNGVTGGAIGNVNVWTWTGLIDGTYSGQQYLKAIGAATAGASSGGPGSPVFKTLDGLTNAISGTANGSGDRSGITYSL